MPAMDNPQQSAPPPPSPAVQIERKPFESEVYDVMGGSGRWEIKVLDHLKELEGNYAKYEQFIEKGVAREMARVVLPVNVYTEWYWKIDLHNLFHFLSLRMDPHAQQEIRDYATAMFELVRPIVPFAAEAFLDYNFQSVHLSRLEVEALRTGQPLATDNKREKAEWEEKRKQMGL